MKYLRATLWIVLGLIMSFLWYTIPNIAQDPYIKVAIKLGATITSMLSVFFAVHTLGLFKFIQVVDTNAEEPLIETISQDGIDEPDKMERVAVFQSTKYSHIDKERLTFSDRTTPVKILGKFGGNRASNDAVIYNCPKCEYRHQIEFHHGDVMKCECGLYSERHGNGLAVWV